MNIQSSQIHALFSHICNFLNKKSHTFFPSPSLGIRLHREWLCWPNKHLCRRAQAIRRRIQRRCQRWSSKQHIRCRCHRGYLCSGSCHCWSGAHSRHFQRRFRPHWRLQIPHGIQNSVLFWVCYRCLCPCCCRISRQIANEFDFIFNFLFLDCNR